MDVSTTAANLKCTFIKEINKYLNLDYVNETHLIGNGVTLCRFNNIIS